jgi:8-oxo-dGTP pyrophosphatase MutT (NUDIX family)
MINTKPYRQAVMAIILKDDGTFLIGSSPRDGGYKFPQGGLEEDEDKKTGLFRELFEELGTILLETDNIELLPASFKYPYPESKPYSKKYSGQELHVFVVQYRKGMTFIPQDNEFDELHWIVQKEMEDFDFKHRKQAYYEAVSNALFT